MDMIFVILVAVVAAWLGWHARAIVMLYNLSRNPQLVIHLLEQLKELDGQEASTEEGIEVRAECVDNCWYAYAHASGQFLAQGPSLEETQRAIERQYPHKKFWYNIPNKSSQTA